MKEGLVRLARRRLVRGGLLQAYTGAPLLQACCACAQSAAPAAHARTLSGQSTSSATRTASTSRNFNNANSGTDRLLGLALAAAAAAAAAASDRPRCSVAIGSHDTAAEPSASSSSGGSSSSSGGSKPGEGKGERSRRPAKPVNPCDKFNSPGWRISWGSRRLECNAIPSCAFVGRSITGTCVPRNPAIFEFEFEPSESTSQGRDRARAVLNTIPKDNPVTLRRQETTRKLMEVVREREEYKDTEGDERERPSKEYIDKVRNLLDALDVNPAARDLALNILEEEGGTAMQAFINAQIAAAAAEEMQRQKHELGEFAKGTVMDLLQAERAPQMMASLFREPSMCATVRTGVQWGLETPYVYDKVTELFEWILNGYLLADGAANEWSREEAAKLIGWVLAQGWTEEAVAPLLAWVLTPEGELDESVLHAVMTALPWMQPSVNETMAWAVDETLKADDYKEYAKGIIVEMLKSQGAQAAANAQAEAHLQRAKARSSKDSITILAGTKDSDHPALDDFASRVRDKGEEALADLKLDTTDSEEDQVGDDSDIGASFNKDANVHKGRPQGGGAARDDGESADGADGQVS